MDLLKTHSPFKFPLDLEYWKYIFKYCVAGVVYRHKLGTLLINWIGFNCAAGFVCKREFKNEGKKRVRDPGRIKRVFSAHCDGSTQNPFPQEKLAPGEALWASVGLCVCVPVYETYRKVTVHKVPQRWDPVFKLDYTPKRKCERAQRSTDRGEALGFANRKKWESHSFPFKPIIFFRLPMLSWVPCL